MTFEQWAWGRGFSLPQMDVAKMAWEAALKAQASEPVVFTQFLTDVITCAGLLSHGKRDKGLAKRISDEACRLMMSHPTTERRVPEDEKLRMALENCRLLAARHRKEDWALLILGFCAEGGVVGSVMR